MPPTVNQIIGANLRKYRLMAGFQTQEQASTKTGIDQPRISRFESGRVRPTDETLEVFARVYKVSNILDFFDKSVLEPLSLAS